MDTSDGRERLAAPGGRDGARRHRPGGGRGGSGVQHGGDPPPDAWSSRPRTPATSRRPSGTPASRGYRWPSRPPVTERPPGGGGGARHDHPDAGGAGRPAPRHRTGGAGVRWRSVIDAAVPYGLAPLSGSSSGVGVVGYTLGGGMGHLARRHGFAADHVRAVELVTADGLARRVTADSDPELFWAVRGGQGRFGIATALEFDLVPLTEFFGGAMVFGPHGGRDACCAPSPTWAPTMPEEVTTSVALLRLPPVDERAAPTARAWSAWPCASASPGLRHGARRCSRPCAGSRPRCMDTVGPMSYAAVDGIHMDPTEPMPAVMRGGLLHSMPDGGRRRPARGGRPGRRGPARHGRAAADGRCPRPAGGGAERGRRARGLLLAWRSSHRPLPRWRRRPPRSPRACCTPSSRGRPARAWSTSADTAVRRRRADTWAPDVLERLRRVKAVGRPRRRLRWRARARRRPGRCAMTRPVVVTEPGRGHRVGNVEFLARTVDTPFFNLGFVVLEPGQGVPSHVHEDEDDSFLVVEGTLSVVVGDDARKVQATAGTFVLVPGRHTARDRQRRHGCRAPPQRPRAGWVRPPDRPALNRRQPRTPRGRGWQRGQENDERFMKCSRRMGVPHLAAGTPGLAVGGERAVEVARGAVDVDVERVEARAALAERLAHHLGRVVEHLHRCAAW